MTYWNSSSLKIGIDFINVNSKPHNLYKRHCLKSVPEKYKIRQRQNETCTNVLQFNSKLKDTGLDNVLSLDMPNYKLKDMHRLKLSLQGKCN